MRDLSEKENFFSKISHDLRGNFTSILGFCDILNDPTENMSNDDIIEFVRRIGYQSHETFELLLNFINWLKLDEYKHGLSKEEIDVALVLHELVARYKKKFENKNIKFITEPNESSKFFLDFEIFHSIMNNIVHFLFLHCLNDSNVTVKYWHDDINFYSMKLILRSNEINLALFQDDKLRDINNDLAFPMIFSIKFIELSGGKFQMSFVEDHVEIILSFPID